MDVKQLVKGEWYHIDNGLKVQAQLLQSPKQGKGFKKIVMMKVMGSQAGFFDEIGSVYVSDIIRPVGNPIPVALFN
jgi:hypothetical protein